MPAKAAAYPDHLCTQPGHSILASHCLLQGLDSPLLSCQLCDGVPGIHPHLGLPLIQIVTGITVNWQQPGPGSYLWPQQNQQQLVTSTPQTPQQTSQLVNSFGGLSTTSPPTAAFQELLDNNSSEGSPANDDAVNNPLVNALAVSAIPGIKGQPYLSLHVANMIKKHIWVGQFIDLAYLLKTQLVPEDSKSYEFACSNSANTNRLNLTASKPKGKIDPHAA